MGTLKVRVNPASGRREVSVGDGRVVVRVRSAPEGGKATEEALRALADALRVPRSAVRLRSGARSRNKLVDVEGIDVEQAIERLGG